MAIVALRAVWLLEDPQFGRLFHGLRIAANEGSLWHTLRRGSIRLELCSVDLILKPISIIYDVQRIEIPAISIFCTQPRATLLYIRMLCYLYTRVFNYEHYSCYV